MNPKLAKRAMKVMGLEVVYDATEGSSIRVHDLSADMGDVAAWIAYWGSVLGSAEEEEILADAHYRAWRAKASKALLDKDSKLSEAKVKMLLEVDPEFLRYKHAIAEARRTTSMSKTMVAAYEAKSRILQSRGARERAELESTGLTTPAKAFERPRKETKASDASAPDAERHEDAPSTGADEGATPAGPKVDKMKSVFGNKKHKTTESRA